MEYINNKTNGNFNVNIGRKASSNSNNNINNETDNSKQNQNNGKYTCRFEIQIENDKDFQVARRLIGAKVILSS